MSNSLLKILEREKIHTMMALSVITDDQFLDMRNVGKEKLIWLRTLRAIAQQELEAMAAK